jgi:epoxyqueuosine reductase
MLAGLGFIGRNTCLIHPKLGSWLFLAVMLVPEELDPDPSPQPFTLPTGQLAWHFSDDQVGTCGQCTRCLQACPTQAFVDAYQLDARRCISYLTIELRGPIPRELRPLMENWIFGCDVCQVVCPWSGSRTRLNPSVTDLEQWAPPLLKLLALDEGGFRQRFRGTAILRAKRRGLLRNVCVAIGNWGDPAAIPALARALNDPEPLIRGHAAWALGQMRGTLARTYLQEALSRERDPWVIEELQLALQEAS